MKILNRQVKANHFIVESVEAGMALTGSEVKSIRAGRVDLNQAFARINNGQVVLKNAYIYPVNGAKVPESGNTRDIKLLLHKVQINNLVGKVAQSGMSLVPLSFYFAHNYAKVELGLVKSKKKFDRRRDIKMRDEARKIERDLKDFGR